MSSLSFAELETAAGAVIEILKTMPGFSHVRIAVIGGLSLWKYLRRYRATEDVDFLITVQGAPNAVKEKLLALPSTPFQQIAQLLFFKGANGKLIQIDITPDWQSPYVTSAAVPISAIRPNALSYISEIDSLVFKINSCGLRPTEAKKRRAATDARALTEDLTSKGIISLTPAQRSEARYFRVWMMWSGFREETSLGGIRSWA